MAVSKRLRYEILRRDGHACRYCGASAPDVPMTVDHVTPVALGGSDDPTNLVTACKPCNDGKSASAPDAPIVADVDAKAVRWAQAMQLAIEKRAAELAADRKRTNAFDRAWSSWNADGEPVPREGNWRNSILRFLAGGLDDQFLADAINTAMGNQRVSVTETWRYFCGICWREMDKIREMAAELADQSIGAPAGVPPRSTATPQQTFPYMNLFEPFIDMIARKLGADGETLKLINDALWLGFPEAHRVYMQRISSCDSVDYDEAELDAWYELVDRAGQFLHNIGAKQPETTETPKEPEDDGFPVMELFDVFLEDVMVSLGATRETRRLASHALWNGFPAAHRAYEQTPKPSSEEGDGALDAAKAALMVHMSNYMPSVGLLMHKPEAVDA